MYIISACLCGINCRYNGKGFENKKCKELLRDGRAIVVCPEQLGGLSTPRNPAELQALAENIIDKNNGNIIDCNRNDVTKAFVSGAYETLKIAKAAGINKAILKDGSPSCGVNNVYDGSFTGKKIKGKGLTAYLLESEGITVFSDDEIEDNREKLISLNDFNKEKAKKRKLFKQYEEADTDGELEYFDLTEDMTDVSDLPESVGKNVKRLMISLARDLMGFTEIDEIAEATGLTVEEVEEIIKDDE